FHFALAACVFTRRVDCRGLERQAPASSLWTLSPGSAPPGAAGCGPAPTNQLACDPPLLARLTARNSQYLKPTSLALFGQLSWHVTDALTIQPGVRVNYDKKSGFYQREVFDGLGNPLSCPAPAANILQVAQYSVFSPQLSAPPD